MEAPPWRLLWALCSPTFPFASQWNGRERLTCGPEKREVGLWVVKGHGYRWPNGRHGTTRPRHA